jgi:hypothetical protein
VSEWKECPFYITSAEVDALIASPGTPIVVAEAFRALVAAAARSGKRPEEYQWTIQIQPRTRPWP